ncbi:MAG: hypothetical protein LBS75_03560 [Synergistaceae bacterium]|nr:hypothetical protein [Synergistaceae bacterium]
MLSLQKEAEIYEESSEKACVARRRFGLHGLFGIRGRRGWRHAGEAVLVVISGDRLDDPHYFGQRTIEDLTVSGGQYVLQFTPEYYIEPDVISSDQNVLYSAITVLDVYYPGVGYVPCLSGDVAYVPAAYAQSTDINEEYFQFRGNFTTTLISSGASIGTVQWGNVYLKIPAAASVEQANDTSR